MSASSWDHVTFAGNIATSGKAGGAYLRGDSVSHPIDLECMNSIFAFNASEDTGSSLGGAFHEDETDGSVGFARSCLHFYENDPAFPSGADCDDCIRDEDPLFCSDAIGAYGVEPDSPAADPPAGCAPYLGSEGLCASAVSVSEDAEIRETNQATGYYADGDTLRVGNETGAGYTTILQFAKSGFSGIASTDVVTGVYLDLYGLADQVEGDPQVRVYRGLRGSTIMNQTNWYQWRSSFGWGVHGARDPKSDYDGGAIFGVQDEWPSGVGGYVSVARSEKLAWWFANYVQAGGPLATMDSYVYLILHLSPAAAGASRVAFSSQDGGLPPRLTVTYTP